MRLDPDSQTTRRALHRAVACLAAFAILVQAFWVPFHLATEHHLTPGEAVPAALAERVLGDAWGCAEAANGASMETAILANGHLPGHPHQPHSTLDHKSAKEMRADPAPLPLGQLAEPALFVWAPPRAGPGQALAIAEATSPPDDPGSTAARPRAPPRSATFAS